MPFLDLFVERMKGIDSTGKANGINRPIGVVDCNRNGPGLNSTHFQDRIKCHYRYPQDHIICH